MILPMEGDEASGWKPGKPTVFLDTPADEAEPMFSPDGRWLAYHSDESGRPEVYVRPFGPPTTVAGKWLVSNGGGDFPVWSPNGKELLYRAGDQIMSVSYSAPKDSFVTEKPRPWVTGVEGIVGFDLAPDGRRIAAMLPIVSKGALKEEHTLIVVQNFFDELRRRVPASK